jgi:hypothetical protein
LTVVAKSLPARPAEPSQDPRVGRTNIPRRISGIIQKREGKNFLNIEKVCL